MNNQLIEKVIKSNDANACVEFTYENPLLDRNVAKALSKSFVKILRVSQQSSNINNNLRHAVLANIRKTCRPHPENHVEIDETVTNLLTEVYIEEVEDPHVNPYISSVEKDLDDFLIRSLKEIDLNSNYHSSLNPEVAQSLINLNERSIETISQNVFNVDIGKEKSLTFLKDLWTKSESIKSNLCNISICMKPEIEKFLLNLCHNVLTGVNDNLEELFCLEELKDLVHKCSISPECFQICCGILNCLFSNVNYSPKILLFISEFVKEVKQHKSMISILYPVHLSHIAVLMDIDVCSMPAEIQSCYVGSTLPYLNNLLVESKSDFVMLLSHYPDWFDIYFEN